MVRPSLARRAALAVAAGLLATAGFDPLALAWLLPLSVAGFVLSVRGLTLPRAALIGAIYGASFLFVLQFWLRVVSWDAWIGLSGLETAFLGLLGAVAALLQRFRAWPVTVAVAWLAIEAWRSVWPFSGMPWGRLAFASADTVWAAGLPYAGTNGVGLLIALTGTTLAWLVVPDGGRAHRTTAALALAGLVGITALPLLAPYRPPVVGTTRVAVVQGDVPGDGSDILLDHRQVTRNHRDVTQQLARDVATGDEPQPDFVVWPENSTAVDPFGDLEIGTAIETAVSAIGVPVLVGGLVDAEDPAHVLNQGIVWDPETGPGERYTKRHPVPFGEYVPWRGSWLTDRFAQLDRIPRDMIAGTRSDPLPIAGVPLTMAICFDIAFDDGLYAQVARGGELVVVQTSNATYIHTNQVDQQFEITRVRAMELGRAVAVASPNGRSGMIAPDGTTLRLAPKREQVVLTADLPLIREVTPAVRIGEWIGWAAMAATALMVLVAVPADAIRRRRERR